MFRTTWSGIERVLVIGPLAYAAIVLLLRITGKRSLSKWNSFDFVVTIALGSILATVIISSQVPLVEGILTFGLLLTFQLIITWLSVRVPFVRRVFKAEPTLLLRKGTFLPEALRHERVTESEVRAAVRSSGFLSLAKVAAVVLETDGSFSVMGYSDSPSLTALSDVPGGMETLRSGEGPLVKE